MSDQKYIRVEEFKDKIAEIGDLRLLSTKTIGEVLTRCATYTPAEILAGMWVPVTERLPVESGYYLIMTPEGHCPMMIVSYSARHKQWNNYDDLNRDKSSAFEDVAHWMPLPKPPGGGDVPWTSSN